MAGRAEKEWSTVPEKPSWYVPVEVTSQNLPTVVDAQCEKVGPGRRQKVRVRVLRARKKCKQQDPAAVSGQAADCRVRLAGILSTRESLEVPEGACSGREGCRCRDVPPTNSRREPRRAKEGPNRRINGAGSSGSGCTGTTRGRRRSSGYEVRSVKVRIQSVPGLSKEKRKNSHPISDCCVLLRWEIGLGVLQSTV